HGQWQERSWGGGQDFRGEGDFSDFFEAIFGGGRGPFGGGAEATWGRGQRGAGPAKGADLEAEIELPLEDLVKGGTRRVTMMARDESGHARPKELDITIPKGMRAGQRIRLKGQGGPG